MIQALQNDHGSMIVINLVLSIMLGVGHRATDLGELTHLLLRL
jgi:tRNA U34 5-carboxymethylaminomethyl modifying GTPase MnmE/TrmE